MLAAIALAMIMVLTAAVALAGSRAASIALIVESVLWLRVSQPVEGPTLVRFTETHGVASNDLIALAGVLVAAVAWQRRARGGNR